MNSTIAKLADEFEKMEKTIASQKKMIETLMPTGYVDTDTVKLHLNSVYGVMFGGRPSPKRCKLEDCSWDEINMYSSFGLADKMFEVGDTKKFRLADGSYLTARIIGFNHDYAEDGSLTHITFETEETLDGDIPMNEKSTNEGGWDASYLRAKLNGNFFEKQLPADLKAVIKPVVKTTAKSGKTKCWFLPLTSCSFFLSRRSSVARFIPAVVRVSGTSGTSGRIRPMASANRMVRGIGGGSVLLFRQLQLLLLCGQRRQRLLLLRQHLPWRVLRLLHLIGYLVNPAPLGAVKGVKT